jgi:hypothetical protein
MMNRIVAGHTQPCFDFVLVYTLGEEGEGGGGVGGSGKGKLYHWAA